MTEIYTLEKVTAVLLLGHITVGLLIAIEEIRTALLLKRDWKHNISFSSIAAFVLSVCVIVRWIS